jgi:hypothetical protein
LKKLVEPEKSSIQADMPTSSTPLTSPVSTTSTPSADDNVPLKEKIQIQLIIEHKNGEDPTMNFPAIEQLLADKISDIIANKTQDPTLHSNMHRPSEANNNIPNSVSPTQSDAKMDQAEDAQQQAKKQAVKRQYNKQRDSSAKKLIMEDWNATNKTNPKALIRNIYTDKTIQAKSHSLTNIPHNNRLSIEGSPQLAEALRPSGVSCRPNQLQLALPQQNNTLMSLRQFRAPLNNYASPRNSPTSSSTPSTPAMQNKPCFPTPPIIQTSTNFQNVSTYSQASTSNSGNTNSQATITSTTAIPTPGMYVKGASVSPSSGPQNAKDYIVCLFCKRNRAEFKCSGTCNIVCCTQSECLQVRFSITILCC